MTHRESDGVTLMASLMEVPVFGSGQTHVIYGKIDAMP